MAKPPTPLEKLKESRNTLRINVGIMESKLKEHLIQPLTLAKVVKYLSTTEAIDVKISDNYDKIIALVDPVDIQPHTVESTSLYEKTLEVLCGFEELKIVLTPVVAAIPTTTVSSSKPDIRLPQLTLLPFSGNVQEWTSYRDIFKSTVHDSVSISKAQKLTYLKSTLSGEAARLLQSISLTDDNYDIAWSLLADRYQNDRELLFSIFRRLFHQPNVQQQSASSLRSLIDVTKECIRSLQALRRPVEHWDDVILFQMFQKLDQASKEL